MQGYDERMRGWQERPNEPDRRSVPHPLLQLLEPVRDDVDIAEPTAAPTASSEEEAVAIGVNVVADIIIAAIVVRPGEQDSRLAE